VRRLLVALALTAACRADDPATPDAPVTPDAPDGTGCTTTTPRMAEPQTFVGPAGLESRMTALIGSATTTLDVQMYLFTVSSLRDAVIAAKNRGVAVRVILDDRNEPGDASTKSAFQSAGVQVQSAPAMYTFSHAKYLIVDHTSAAIMSMNFNVDAMSNERNYGMIDTDIEDLADLQAVFDTDWALASGANVPQPALTCTRLIVSPINAQQRTLETIAGAHTTLDVEAFYISDTNVRNAIQQAHNRGVAVRVILADPSDMSDNATTATFFANAGIPVKYEQQFFLHAKLLVADGVAYIGSQNFSPTSLQDNREVAALVFEPGPEAMVASTYESDFAAAAPAP
jgi:cardiolipin synthase A/B